MGVLVPGPGDQLAVKRTADFFLKSFQERLDTQRQERETKGAPQCCVRPLLGLAPLLVACSTPTLPHALSGAR